MSAAELTCNQVNGLLSFYVDGKLSESLKNMVESHLEKCPYCRKKLEEMKIMINSLKEIFEKISTIPSSVTEKRENKLLTSQYNDFHQNLSAYIDNELNDQENLTIKKYVISNPIARKELESSYKLQTLINKSIETTRKNAGKDFSSNVLKQIDFNDNVYASESFFMVIGIFILIFSALTILATQIFAI